MVWYIKPEVKAVIGDYTAAGGLVMNPAKERLAYDEMEPLAINAYKRTTVFVADGDPAVAVPTSDLSGLAIDFLLVIAHNKGPDEIDLLTAHDTDTIHQHLPMGAVAVFWGHKAGEDVEVAYLRGSGGDAEVEITIADYPSAEAPA